MQDLLSFIGEPGDEVVMTHTFKEQRKRCKKSSSVARKGYRGLCEEDRAIRELMDKDMVKRLKRMGSAKGFINYVRSTY